MRATDSQRAARRLYLAMRARGVKLDIRPVPGKPIGTAYRVGVSWPGSVPNPKGIEFKRAMQEAEAEILSLIEWVPNDPDAKAILQEGMP